MSLVSLKHVIENRSNREHNVMNFTVDIINNNDDRKEMMSYSIDQGLKHVDEFEVEGETYRVEIGRHKDIYIFQVLDQWNHLSMVLQIWSLRN